MSNVYPLLAKLPKAPSTICTQFRTILLAAGHVAGGDVHGVTSAFRYIDPQNHKKAYELAVVQAMPFIGIPRALHAAAALQIMGAVGDSDHSTLASIADLEQKGEHTFNQIYGRNAYRVRKRLKQFHPFVEQWVITCNYGAMLSRNDATLRERELAAVAALSVDRCASVQLASHIRGAFKVGASYDEIKMTVEHARVLAQDDDWQSSEAVLQTWDRARYAL
ncbi:4-carboxymuconolactone decarboxylase [Gracilaria domingensis]|nr:4-carboxymuconolactone decarboxylase [Gracilaria domingensis]